MLGWDFVNETKFWYIEESPLSHKCTLKRLEQAFDVCSIFFMLRQIDILVIECIKTMEAAFKPSNVSVSLMFFDLHN